VIAGGVQQQDSSVRVTARIIDTRNGDVITALKLDGSVTELTQIQSDLVSAIHESIADTFETGETIPEALPATAVDATPGISITVQRFENVTETPQVAQFEDAIRTTVTERLQTVEGITLVASEAQPQLTVNGGIQQSGNLVRITATLVDSRDDSVLRAVKVDGVIEEFSSVRDQVAAAIHQTVVEVLNGTTGDTTTSAGQPLTIRPFANISQRPEDAELAEAVAAAITNRLGTVRTTSIVTTEENALWVISGSIQRIGNVIRITANLIDREESSVVHSIKIDGPVDQLERLQSDVATELTNTVREATS
jgi:TolB-like protein